MNTSEFSEEFDIYYNNICSNKAPGLDVYEKSVFLTQAQEEVIKESYSGQLTSFELTEAVRRSLDPLVKFITIDPLSNDELLDGVVFNLPKDCWFITYESAKIDSELPCLKDAKLQVVPITQDELNRVKRNPFRGPSRYKALRVDIGNSKVLIDSIYKLESYTIGYISKPKPIILEPLEDGLTIDGVSDETECILNTFTHRGILERAVQKAAASYKQISQN